MTCRNDPTPPSSGPGAATPCDSTVQSCPLTKSLAGEVIEVEWNSGIRASLGKATVPTPHWEVGAAVFDGAGSKRPGVYLVQGKGSDAVTVTVRITDNTNISGNGQLKGQLGSLQIEGTCPTAVGDHRVSARITSLPDAIAHEKGDVAWGLDVPDLGSTITLSNTTRLEAFVVLDTPAGFYDPPGVWVEALRFVCGSVGLIGLQTNDAVAARVTTYCHGSHGLTYDTDGGRPFYGVGGGGGSFKLGDYLAAALPVVNCYDQAAGVQALCGAVGVPIVWHFLAPFGYINTTDLIGIGSCNNPFFTTNGSAAVVSPDDPRRTAFGNHAFGGLAGKIADACAGPHTGTETKSQYCTASIDATPSLYPGGSRPGTAADIVDPGGISGLV